MPTFRIRIYEEALHCDSADLDIEADTIEAAAKIALDAADDDRSPITGAITVPGNEPFHLDPAENDTCGERRYCVAINPQEDDGPLIGPAPGWFGFLPADDPTPLVSALRVCAAMLAHYASEPEDKAALAHAKAALAPFETPAALERAPV